jgi:hypothetical protein
MRLPSDHVTLAADAWSPADAAAAAGSSRISHRQWSFQWRVSVTSVLQDCPEDRSSAILCTIPNVFDLVASKQFEMQRLTFSGDRRIGDFYPQLGSTFVIVSACLIHEHFETPIQTHWRAPKTKTTTLDVLLSTNWSVVILTVSLDRLSRPNDRQ